jgi:hypothetical protein
MDPHRIGKLGHAGSGSASESEKPDLDLHQSENPGSNLHQHDVDPQHCRCGGSPRSCGGSAQYHGGSVGLCCSPNPRRKQ